MERAFVKILNSTLLVGAFICLMIVGAAAVFLVINLDRSIFAQTASARISVSYVPANIAFGQGGVNQAASTDGSSALLKAAHASCAATNTLYEFISNRQYGLADSEKCASEQAETAQQQFGDRAANLLTERAAYFQAVEADDQARAIFNIPAGSDVGALTQKYSDEVDAAFTDKFRAMAAADDARKAHEISVSVDARAAAIALGTIAASAFVLFLVIAFLIVAVRLEKHLGRIEAKI